MATQEPKQQRDFTLSVRLRPDMREKLGFVADSLGVSPATVASMAVGHYVASQHASLTASSKAMESIIGAIAPGMLEALKTISTEGETPCLSSSESSVQLPLLVAATTKKQAKSSPRAQSSKSKRSTTVASSK